jgi:hypothetical protein
VFLKGDHVAAFERGEPFIHIRLSLCKVVLFENDFGNALIDKLPHGLLDRRKVASSKRAVTHASCSGVRVIVMVCLIFTRVGSLRGKVA